MQRLLEHRSPLLGSSGSARAIGSLLWRPYFRTVLCIIIVTAYVAFVALPRLSLAEDEFLSATPSSDHRNSEVTPLPPSVPLRESHPSGGMLANTLEEIPMLPPWGYNEDRNVPRWKAIYRSIMSDHRSTFTLVDHGADQGYFSISIAKFFPDSLVMGLELGGVGGEIWSKGKKQMDVLSIQESHLADNHVSNMIICQTRMHQSHFFALKEAGARSDYQLMLSVFHWFELPTRQAFEEAIVALFATARTTFIELPTIGDNSDLIKKQVGYKNFAKWYDGRTDVHQILLDAAAAQHVQIRVQRILVSKWIRWTREVYRVDYLGAAGSEGHLGTDSGGRGAFQCNQRRAIYGCKDREKYAACPTSGTVG